MGWSLLCQGLLKFLCPRIGLQKPLPRPGAANGPFHAATWEGARSAFQDSFSCPRQNFSMDSGDLLALVRHPCVSPRLRSPPSLPRTLRKQLPLLHIAAPDTAALQLGEGPAVASEAWELCLAKEGAELPRPHTRAQTWVGFSCLGRVVSAKHCLQHTPALCGGKRTLLCLFSSPTRCL